MKIWRVTTTIPKDADGIEDSGVGYFTERANAEQWALDMADEWFEEGEADYSIEYVEIEGRAEEIRDLLNGGGQWKGVDEE